MYGVSLITGALDPSATRRPETRDPRTETPPPAKDSLAVSDDARQAAAAARIIKLSEQGEEIRAERVAEAKKSIEEGTYRVHEAVLRVAVRLLNTTA